MQRKQFDSLGIPGFVLDQSSVQLGQGRLIDWVAVTSGFGTAGNRIIPAGTIVCLRPDGTLIPAALRTTEPYHGILVDAAHENSRSDAITGYGVYRGGGFYANYLPDYSHGSFATWVTGLGNRFYFEELDNSLLEDGGEGEGEGGGGEDPGGEDEGEGEGEGEGE